MRIVIELKRGEVGEVILNNLYKQTQLQDTFGMNMVALVDGQPRLLNLKQMLECFLAHRREVVTRRTVSNCAKPGSRPHPGRPGRGAFQCGRDHRPDQGGTDSGRRQARPDGAYLAQSPVEQMLQRAAADASRPEGLAPEFGMSGQGYWPSDAQAQAILELRLQRLTGLEQDKIVAEYKEVMEEDRRPPRHPAPPGAHHRHHRRRS